MSAAYLPLIDGRQSPDKLHSVAVMWRSVVCVGPGVVGRYRLPARAGGAVRKSTVASAVLSPHRVARGRDGVPENGPLP